MCERGGIRWIKKEGKKKKRGMRKRGEREKVTERQNGRERKKGVKNLSFSPSFSLPPRLLNNDSITQDMCLYAYILNRRNNLPPVRVLMHPDHA